MYVIRLRNKRRVRRRLDVLNDVSNTIVGLSMLFKPLVADVGLMPTQLRRRFILFIC